MILYLSAPSTFVVRFWRNAVLRIIFWAFLSYAIMDAETCNFGHVRDDVTCVRSATVWHFERKLRLEKSSTAQIMCSIFMIDFYRGADKSLARPGRKQANVSVRMAWISFRPLPCRGEKKTWWQLASRCCWNRERPLHASELISFLVGLRTYQHPILPNLVLWSMWDLIQTSVLRGSQRYCSG